jgi:phosphatidylglycerol:prolipoprotein diacylglycerol transferase
MHPRLLTTDYFVLHTFGVFLLTAFLAAIWWVTRGARHQGISTDWVTRLSLWLIGGALFGAKLFMIARKLLEQSPHPGQFFSLSLLEGVGDFYGGFLGALVVAAIYFRQRPVLPAWRIADLFAPAVALGQAIGRIGCLMAGDDYGRPTRLPWGVTFTNPEASRLGGVPLGVALHPVQLYESLVCLGLFFFLVWLTRRRKFDGEIVLTYALGYAVSRFVIEYFRGDSDRGFVFGGLFSTSQFIALLVGAASSFLLVRRARHAGSNFHGLVGKTDDEVHGSSSS